ncbi:Inversin [Varanus komodoensis]|nr:Inversin [Varanus komodoensis]
MTCPSWVALHSIAYTFNELCKPLHHDKAGNYRFMKLLLARRANWMKKDLEEITPLHLTTRHKSPKCLALLLKYMAPGEVDTQDKNKQTALHWSAYYNNPEHVKLLIKHDSNIGIPDIEGKIPLHWAANHKDPSAVHTVKCILDAAPTESLLNWQDYEGRTPLHFAVADGNVAVVDLLTSYEGCNVTSYDNLFRTPLHWAALLGHAQIVHLLLERNKVRTIPSDSQGATPLHYAAQSNFAETVEAFLKHPSVKDDSDLEGRTSFMWAAGKGSDDVIQTMLNLKLDIDINMADKYGGTEQQRQKLGKSAEGGQGSGKDKLKIISVDCMPKRSKNADNVRQEQKMVWQRPRVKQDSSHKPHPSDLWLKRVEMGGKKKTSLEKSPEKPPEQSAEKSTISSIQLDNSVILLQEIRKMKTEVMAGVNDLQEKTKKIDVKIDNMDGSIKELAKRNKENFQIIIEVKAQKEDREGEERQGGGEVGHSNKRLTISIEEERRGDPEEEDI